jgi:hypothetical protein
MGRERLEGILDALFANQLSNRSFLLHCVDNLRQRSAQQNAEGEIKKLTSEVNKLRRKRERVVDSYIEGAIENRERDKRLVTIDDNIRVCEEVLAQKAENVLPDTEKLIEAFAPLAEWEYWTREQKRRVLSTLIPDIRVADYEVDSLGLNTSVFCSEDTRKGRDSSPPPA